MKFSTLLFILLVLFASCKEKKYYYIEGANPEEIITADTDSSAFLQAIQKFVTSRKAHMNDSPVRVGLLPPKRFFLLNAKRRQVWINVFYIPKDCAERTILAWLNPDINKAAMEKANFPGGGIRPKFDTAGLYLYPVKVWDAVYTSEGHPNYKDVTLRYTNTGRKAIASIKFQWYGENACFEPAEVQGSKFFGRGSGSDDSGLQPGATNVKTFTNYSHDGEKIVIAYAWQIVFKDGTVWYLKDRPSKWRP